MARRQPFSESVLQRFDGIPLVKTSKRRRSAAWTPGKSVDRMAVRTVGLREGFAAPNALYVRKRRTARHDL